MKSKGTLLATLCLLLTAVATSFGQSGWLTTFGGVDGQDYGHHVGVDEEGSVYVAAQFLGTVMVGEERLENESISHFGFIKMSSEGRPLWVKRVNVDDWNVRINGVEFDGKGHYYLFGEFYGTMTIGSSTLTAPKSGRGSADGFIAKYRLDGTPVSAWQMTGIGNDEVIDAVVDPSGALYVVGGFANTGDFGVETFESTGFHEGFVARVSPSMQTEWVVALQASKTLDYITGVDIAEGNPVICGVITDTGTLGPRSIEAENRTGFVAGLTPTGTIRWVTLFDGRESSGKLPSFTTDREGNAYMMGRYHTRLNIDGIELQNEDFFDSYYVAKFDTEGRVRWAKTGGGVAMFPQTLHVNTNGDVVAFGSFNDSAIFGQVREKDRGDRVAFVVTYDKEGNQKDVDIWRSDSLLALRGVTSDRDGWLYAVGGVGGNATLAGREVSEHPSGEGYVLKFAGYTQPTAVDVELVPDLAAGPNPCRSCNYRITSPTEPIVSVVIHDVRGTQIRSLVTDRTTVVDLDLSGLASGLYHFSLEHTTGKVSTQSVVVE